MTGNKFAALAAAGMAQDATKEQQEAPEVRPAEQVRMLGGRVPDSIFREFQMAKFDAEGQTGLRRITTEEAVEAFVRLLRDEETKAKWVATVAQVRQGRRR